MAQPYDGFDLSDFWENSDYARKTYIDDTVSEDLVDSIEAELGIRFPASYVALMRTQNGGIPRDRCFPTSVPTSWARDHVAISGILGIGRKKMKSLCGDFGSEFMRLEWGYPDTGICVCDCPSAGHDMIMLDYRKCGRQGEPEVVHVDQECDYATTFLAQDFESFIRGLVNESVYKTSGVDAAEGSEDEEAEEWRSDVKKDLRKIENGAFSKLLAKLISASGDPTFGVILRNVCKKLTTENGDFALRDDELSWLAYDIQFYLYTMSHKVRREEKYLEKYPEILALATGEFTTGVYVEGYVDAWLNVRLSNREIVRAKSGSLEFSRTFVSELMRKLGEYE